MAKHIAIGTISETTPASAQTLVSPLPPIGGLQSYDAVEFIAELVGATGGTLDVYLQGERVLADGTSRWVDIAHFPQLPAGAAAVVKRCACFLGSGIATTGFGTDGTPSLALANDTIAPGHPGNRVRAVYVAGASTSAGAAIKIHVFGWQGVH